MVLRIPGFKIKNFFPATRDEDQGMDTKRENPGVREVWIQMEDTTGAPFFEGNFLMWIAGPTGGAIGTSWKVPSDFTQAEKIEVILIPEATDSAMNIDAATDFAAVGEARTAHTASDTTSTYSVVDDQIFAMDITGLYGALQADDYVGLQITNNDATDDIQVLGIRFRYT